MVRLPACTERLVQCELVELVPRAPGRQRASRRVVGRLRLASSFAGWLILGGCVSNGPRDCAGVAVSVGGVETWTDEVTPAGSANPYADGGLAVTTRAIEACDRGAPFPLRVHYPSGAGPFPLVVFIHGFQGWNYNYGDILRQLASHGFVVVAPQMYPPGLTSLLGSPSGQEEAEDVPGLVTWLRANLYQVISVRIATDRVGLAGHSRGGGVIWSATQRSPQLATALALVDPVGLFGSSGPGPGPSVPAMVFGAGLGGSCAPAGRNHDVFFDAATGPRWHVVAKRAGHGDMMNEEAARAAALFCRSGEDRDGVRKLTAGCLVGIFRAYLHDDPSALTVIESADSAPVSAVVEFRR